MNLSNAALGAATFVLVSAITARPVLADHPAGFESALTQIRADVQSVRAEHIQAAAENLAGRIESASKEAGRLGGQALLVKAMGALLKRLRDDQRDGLSVVLPSDPFLRSRLQRAIANLVGLANGVSLLQGTVEGLARAVRPDMGLAVAAEKLRAEALAIDSDEWVRVLPGRLVDELNHISRIDFIVETRDLEQQAGNFARARADLCRAADILVLRAKPPTAPSAKP